MPSFLSVAMLLAQNTQVSMPIHRLATVYTSKITSCGTVQSYTNGDGEREGRVQGYQRHSGPPYLGDVVSLALAVPPPLQALRDGHARQHFVMDAGFTRELHAVHLVAVLAAVNRIDIRDASGQLHQRQVRRARSWCRQGNRTARTSVVAGMMVGPEKNTNTDRPTCTMPRTGTRVSCTSGTCMPNFHSKATMAMASAMQYNPTTVLPHPCRTHACIGAA